LASRNQMHMAVKDCLSNSFAAVHNDIEANNRWVS
jgi:hypothetical protein